MSRFARMGTAEKTVLLKLTQEGCSGTWQYDGGRALYESRALTLSVCERLTLKDYLEEMRDDGRISYTVTKAGRQEAAKLRKAQGGWSGFIMATDG